MRYEHLIREITKLPWNIMREKLEDVMMVVDRGVRGVKLSPVEIKDAVGDSAKDIEARTAFNAGIPQSVAVLPLYGVMTPRGPQMQDSGLTGTEGLTKAIQKAAASAQVSEIVLDVNSPGGSVFGLEEAAQAIRDAKKEKPVYAIANPLMASAAYYVAAQASELWMADDALIGSIGTYSMHVDYSGALAKDGIKVTFVSAGKYKVEGNAYEELSEKALLDMQDMVNRYYGEFVGAVAKGRNTTAKIVKNGMGEGRVVMVKEALSENMVDKVGSLQALLGSLGVQGRGRKRSRAQANADMRDLELQELGVQVPLKSELPEEPEGDDPADETNKSEVSTNE